MNCPECDTRMEIINRNGKEYWDCPSCAYSFLVNQEEANEDE